VKETIRAINGEKYRCPFCDNGNLRVADITYDPFVWLECTGCRAQIRLSRRVPEPVFEKPCRTGGGWEVDRATIDREARTW
jgi:hypothetical protein